MERKFETNTHIAEILDVSTYEGPFSYESLWSGEEESEREEGRLVCDDYRHDLLGEQLVHEANLVFDADKPLADYGVKSIKATKFGSPREYNFTTDWLDLEVTVDEAFFDKALAAIDDPKNRKAIVDYCKAHWVSNDGFSSSMLNRVSRLSLDHWRHSHYGTHLSTDAEIEAAVMADLAEAIVHLRYGTGDDDFREFGAILVLLWLFEYPEDFTGDEWPWMTTQMFEHMRGNSSLSAFCTVLDKDEIAARFGDHMCRFDAFQEQVEKEKSKYLESDFPDPAHAKATVDRFTENVKKYLDDRRRDELDVISENIGSGDEAVCAKLDEFRQEWNESVYAALRKLWGKDYDDVRDSV